MVTPVFSRAGLVTQKGYASHLAPACSSVSASWPAGAANKSYTDHGPLYLPIADWCAACSAGARLTVLLGLASVSTFDTGLSACTCGTGAGEI